MSLSIVLVRHAQGTHNVAAQLYGIDIYQDPFFTDAQLTQEGEQQALHASSLLQFHGLRDDVDLVVSSPLRRTLHTATLLYANHETPPPFVACELAREAHGLFTSDKRSSVSHLSALYPHVDFRGVATEEDTWHDPLRRETVGEVHIRSLRFLRWLVELALANSLSRVIVVSLGVFLD